MKRDMIADLLTTLRTTTNDAVKQNALDLLYKLQEDGVRGAKGAIEAIERFQARNPSASVKPNSHRSRAGTQERRLSNGRMTN